ncbi:hypothetical protein Cde04nite_23260 [Cellulomonas denverensis]|nr:hypothetical protein Cde04nite_23260 [Cellulomonas denverensis]
MRLRVGAGVVVVTGQGAHGATVPAVVGTAVTPGYDAGAGRPQVCTPGPDSGHRRGARVRPWTDLPTWTTTGPPSRPAPPPLPPAREQPARSVWTVVAWEDVAEERELRNVRLASQGSGWGVGGGG